MANLYLTEQGSVLRKTGDRLIMQKDDEIQSLNRSLDTVSYQ